MGQNDSESAAEFVMTVRTDHVAMKTWFNNQNNTDSAIVALKEKYGEYPALWKEVLNWPGWKEARKEYLRYTQQQQEQPQNTNGDGNSNTNAAATSTNNDNVNNNNNNSENNTNAPRKRKSRWGSASASATLTSTSEGGVDDGTDEASKQQQRRSSRWGQTDEQQHQSSMDATVAANNSNNNNPLLGQTQPMLPPGLSSLLPGILPGTQQQQQLTPEQQEEMKILQARLRIINEKLDNLEAEAERVDALPRSDPERSPSPPPVYGPDGKRKNTRAVRWRERYTTERQDVLEKLLQVNPNTRKSSASNIFFRKRSKKIRIPIEKHPNYNFIGLIIGPRGKTQKELEAKTGCKIAIRGRGSVKEGARGRRDGQVMQGDNDPLHVVITGDDQQSVDAASEMIEQMLIVIDDEKNVHKQQQLRELALLNGTLKDEDVFCTYCAEKGHRSFECPKQLAASKKQNALQVKCAICGDTSHPTRDCRQVKPVPVGGVTALPQKNQQEIDSDYLSFMDEIEGKKIEPPQEQQQPQPPPAVPDSLPPPLPSATSLPPPPPAGGVQPPLGTAPPLLAPSASSLPPPPLQHHLPPPSSIPSNLPPPPHSIMGGAGGLPPVGLPPPPPVLPLPPPSAGPPNNYYGNNNRQQFPPPPGYGGGGYNQQGQHQQQRNHYPPQSGQHYQNQYPPYQHHQQQQPPAQQQQQVKPGEETTAWDPNAWYGSGGAGEMNWWE